MSAAQVPTAPATGYFVDQKKGEVNELKQLLKNINVERDVKRKREILKKVIAYMTLGIDVSRLFTEMIMAIETKDIVIKKMVYLYLCNYAHKQPDMAIMCINSLLRDCDNEDPMVRGLALRSLCNLRLDSILEYVGKPLQKSLQDVSAYVRKTAVMSILKLNSLSPGFAETFNYIQQIYRLLEDPDATVVTNSVMVLNELLLAKGGMEINQHILMHLLNRIGEFSEWGLNAILDLVSRYKTTSEEEIFAIMNLLDPVLRTANSGAVLATFKCFMTLTASLPELHTQIMARSKPPFLTLITGSNPDIQYTMLKHLECIISRNFAKGIFDDEYRQFFVRYNEPSYVKYLKTELIPHISNSMNSRDIINELVEYVTDVDSELSKKSIDAIGEIAVRVPLSTGDILQTLLSLVDLEMPYVRSQAVRNICKILRIMPSSRQQILPMLSKFMRRVEDPETRAMVIWMIGEYGEEFTEAPYLIEPIINSYEEEQSIDIKLNLLSTSMKLFFKRPPEVHKMLGRLLSMAVNDVNSQDVHDKALLYYRLLTTNVEAASSLFKTTSLNGSTADSLLFAENRNYKKRDKIYSEFNTLAVIYSMCSFQFINDQYQLKVENAPLSDDFLTVRSPIARLHTMANQSVSSPLPSITQHIESQNLLDFDDSATPAIPSAPSIAAVAHLRLSNLAKLTPEQFQNFWGSFPELFNGKITSCSSNKIPKSTHEIDAVLIPNNIFPMASGMLSPPTSGMKFFLYSSGDYGEASGGVFLVQMIVMTPGDITVTIKSNFDVSASEEYISILSKALSICF